MLAPELQELVFQIELLTQLCEQTAVPLLRAHVLADGRQIEHRHAYAILAQPRGGAHHQGRFAHLTRGEHVTELALFEVLVEFGVGLSLDVAWRIAAQGSPDNVEAGCESGLCCANRMLPSTRVENT